MTEQLIRYTIITHQAFSSHEKPVTEAMAHVKQLVQKKQAWLYINGQIKNIEEITVDDFEKASTITLTNVILTG